MTDSDQKSTSTAWAWRGGLTIITIIIAIFRHFSVLNTMWLHVAWFGGGLVLGALIRSIDRRVLLRWYRTAEGDNTKLITESTLFSLCLIPLSLFVVTSSGSALGAGLILGIWIGVWADLVSAPNFEVLQARYLYQLKQPLSQTQISWLIRGILVWLIVLTVWVMF